MDNGEHLAEAQKALTNQEMSQQAQQQQQQIPVRNPPSEDIDCKSSQ